MSIAEKVILILEMKAIEATLLAMNKELRKRLMKVRCEARKK